MGAACVDERRSVSTYIGRGLFFFSLWTWKMDDGEGKRGTLFLPQTYVH